jgi:hypothetical protein
VDHLFKPAAVDRRAAGEPGDVLQAAVVDRGADSDRGAVNKF